MVKSTMQKMKAGNIQISGVIFNRVTGWSHSTTMCHNSENTKAITKKIFHAKVDLYLLTICAIFLGKVTKTRKIRAKEDHISINTLSSKFCMLLLIMGIN